MEGRVGKGWRVGGWASITFTPRAGDEHQGYVQLGLSLPGEVSMAAGFCVCSFCFSSFFFFFSVKV